MTINVGNMSINEKLDGTNYDNWSLKVQFLLNYNAPLEGETSAL